jgi:predicted membrane protein
MKKQGFASMMFLIAGALFLIANILQHGGSPFFPIGIAFVLIGLVLMKRNKGIR